MAKVLGSGLGKVLGSGADKTYTVRLLMHLMCLMLQYCRSISKLNPLLHASATAGNFNYQ